MIMAAGSNGTLIFTPQEKMDYLYLGVIIHKHKCDSRWVNGLVTSVQIKQDVLINALAIKE